MASQHSKFNISPEFIYQHRSVQQLISMYQKRETSTQILQHPSLSSRGPTQILQHSTQGCEPRKTALLIKPHWDYTVQVCLLASLLTGLLWTLPVLQPASCVMTAALSDCHLKQCLHVKTPVKYEAVDHLRNYLWAWKACYNTPQTLPSLSGTMCINNTTHWKEQNHMQVPHQDCCTFMEVKYKFSLSVGMYLHFCKIWSFETLKSPVPIFISALAQFIPVQL